MNDKILKIMKIYDKMKEKNDNNKNSEIINKNNIKKNDENNYIIAEFDIKHDNQNIRIINTYEQ